MLFYWILKLPVQLLLIAHYHRYKKTLLLKSTKRRYKDGPVSDEGCIWISCAVPWKVGLITAIGVYNLNEEDSREIFYLDTMGKDLPYQTNGGYTVTAYPSEKELLTAFSDFCRPTIRYT